MTLRLVLTLPFVALLMLAPAGSVRYWQGWAFVGVFAVFSVAFSVYFYRHDPKLLERRLQGKEPRRAQKIFKIFWVPLWLVTLVLPGLDYRFGWSPAMPAWLSAAAWAGMIGSWALVFHVMRVNTFASAVVKVEAEQRVITDGPYGIVRHPMYTGFCLMTVATPFALGSYVAVCTALPLIPVIVFRLFDEERALREELPGYTEYCERTRFRLIPLVF